MPESATRSFIADTLALVVFFTVTGALNERFVAGMSWQEVAVSRGIGAPLMVLTARPYGLWRDWFMSRFLSEKPTIADGAALLMFQVPIYAGILWASGASGQGLLTGTAFYAVLMLVLGRPYGMWLDFVRKGFGLKGPGQKPMSLGG